MGKKDNTKEEESSDSTTTTTRTTDSFDSDSDASIPVSKDDGDDLAQLKELIDYQNEDNNNADIIDASTTTTTATSTAESTTIEEIEKEEEKGKKEKVANKWPQFVGWKGERAKLQLETLYGVGTYTILILNDKDPTTKDYRFNRIRIFVNAETQRVTEIPRIG